MAPAPIFSDELQRLERDRFVQLFGGVFEHAPWVAEQAFAAGPFHSARRCIGRWSTPCAGRRARASSP